MFIYKWDYQESIGTSTKINLLGSQQLDLGVEEMRI